MENKPIYGDDWGWLIVGLPALTFRMVISTCSARVISREWRYQQLFHGEPCPEAASPIGWSSAYILHILLKDNTKWVLPSGKPP